MISIVRKSILLVLVCLLGQQALASINRAALALAAPSNIFFTEDGSPLSPKLITDFYAVRFHEEKLDAAKMIPTDMQASENQNEVFGKVADQSLSSWFNSDAMRATTLGRAATTVEKELQQEVVIQTKNSVQHKFNFNVQAFQALAQIQYEGFFHSALRYKLAQAKFDLEISQQMFGNKELLLNTTGDASEVAVRWIF
jgi:hypothetical protein